MLLPCQTDMSQGWPYFGAPGTRMECLTCCATSKRIPEVLSQISSGLKPKKTVPNPKAAAVFMNVDFTQQHCLKTLNSCWTVVWTKIKGADTQCAVSRGVCHRLVSFNLSRVSKEYEFTLPFT